MAQKPVVVFAIAAWGLVLAAAACGSVSSSPAGGDSGPSDVPATLWDLGQGAEDGDMPAAPLPDGSDTGRRDTQTPGEMASDTGGLQPDVSDLGGADTAEDHSTIHPPDVTVPPDTATTGCQLNESRCEGTDIVMRCNYHGDWEAQPCLSGLACWEGECWPRVCSPNETVCVDDHTYNQCHFTGTFWDENKDCSGNYFCDFQRNECLCVNPANVMFVLDASGSMQMQTVNGQTQWEIARQAIAQIMQAYPQFKYGLTTFPDTPVDCSPTLCRGNGGCDASFFDQNNYEVGALPTDINNYLAGRPLSADIANLQYVRTPLLGILGYFLWGYLDVGPLKNGPYPAYLVVLSDGEDSCHNVLHPAFATGPIGQAVRQLRDQFEIKTFSIGFNIESGEEQLNAMAMNGGTGLSTYLSAVDMPSLMSALAEVVDLIDPYKCVGINEILPPDCTDSDGDGWCDFADCDDSQSLVNPAATEVFGNSVDDDCNGLTDEPPPEQFDDDGDGVSEVQGDCNDFEPRIGPAAADGNGPDADGVDNDCDSLTDEGPHCSSCQGTGNNVANVMCAMELCDSAFVLNSTLQNLSNISASTQQQAMAAVSRFGAAGNELAPHAGISYGLLATGPAVGTSHNSWLCGELSSPTTCAYSGDPMFDAIEIAVTLTAPRNAQGFSFEYVFFSEEYEEYIGTEYNDKFFVIMNAPQTTGGQDRIINFTNCRSGSYFDFADPACSQSRCCYIAINTAFSEPCSNPQTNIAGTGFECPGFLEFDSEMTGSSTGWLTTTMTVSAGETFTLRFHVHDTSDGYYDSEVILDNFRWHSTPVTPGTEPSGT